MPRDDKTNPPDPAPVVGAATDVSPLTHRGPKPAHEPTANEEAGLTNWKAIAAGAPFRELVRAKRRFIIPAMLFSILYYFALPVLVGWFPDLMKKKVPGGANLAYLFALSQFFMAWFVAGLYLVKAGQFDRQAQDLISREAR